MTDFCYRYTLIGILKESSNADSHHSIIIGRISKSDDCRRECVNPLLHDLFIFLSFFLRYSRLIDAALIGNFFDHPFLFKNRNFGQMLLLCHAMQQRVKEIKKLSFCLTLCCMIYFFRRFFFFRYSLR